MAHSYTCGYSFIAYVDARRGTQIAYLRYGAYHGERLLRTDVAPSSVLKEDP